MEEIQAARAKAIEPLAQILEERGELQRKLAALDEPYGKAFAAAEAAGWSAEELKALGADEPAKRPKGRPRTRRSGTRKAAAATSATTAPAPAIPAQENTGGPVAAAAGNLSD
ncbi:hypothetical protein CUT44_14035 [Streptomyces carminius]|uniref:Uncharacterized protein n=2 Tax=Streptomyces carminius TaxID=2665496 RepID=A0A2M8LYT6_9ACTN|nr:hypothetical protein CUT44_14035 [Streptomyces carminius]